MTSPPAELLLVRHGETTGESSIRLNGVTDVPLSDLGRRQMEAVGARLAGLRIDHVLASPLRRSTEGAALAASGYAGRVDIVPAFIEIDFGDWEGLTVDEIAERDAADVRRWREAGDSFTFPNGENRGAFWTRIATEARSRFAAPTGRSVAVLHKGVIKGIWGTLLGLERAEIRNIPVDLGGIFHLDWTGSRWRPRLQNDVRHLGALAIPDSVRRADVTDPSTGP